MTYKNLARLAETRGLILASGSPRRFELLSETSVPFERIVPDLKEKKKAGEIAFDYALRMAREKALHVASQQNGGKAVLGCDTIVVLGDRILEKPADRAGAFEALSLLSGKQHVVCTSLAFAIGDSIAATNYELTKVFFNHTTSEQIEEYIDSGEPMDKAGAYGIQGMGAFLVDRIEGNLDTVIGLPRKLLDALSQEVLRILQES